MRCASNDLSDAQSLIARFEHWSFRTNVYCVNTAPAAIPTCSGSSRLMPMPPWTAHLIGHIGNGPIAQHDAPAP